MGTFGDSPWHFSDPESGWLPKDLQREQDIEERESESAKQQETFIKKKILSEWKG